MYVIILITILFILWKWVIFILLAPLLAVRNHRKNTIGAFGHQSFSEHKTKSSFRKFVNGFIRFMSIKIQGKRM